MFAKDNYDDIIHLPHHVSPTRPPMPMRARAAQFTPFAAVRGYGDAVLETQRLTDREIELSEEEKAVLDRKMQILVQVQKSHPEIHIRYFVPDARKSGGEYREVSGKVKKIDLCNKILFLDQGHMLHISSISDIQSPLFAEE